MLPLLTAAADYRTRPPHAWQVQLPLEADVLWTSEFSKKVSSLRAFQGRYVADHLYGHKSGVRAIKLLAHHNLLATGVVQTRLQRWFRLGARATSR